MDITLYSFSKRSNSTKRPSGGVTVSGILREGANLRSPSFILTIPADQVQTYMGYNYAQVLGQYYYVGDLVNLSATEWEMPMTLDELATYKSAIQNTEAFVLYSASDYDEYINDTRLDVKPNYQTIIMTSTHSAFAPDTAWYVLSVVNTKGNTPGCVYAVTNNGMTALTQDLGDTDFLDSISAFIHGEPMQALIGCRVYPVGVGYFAQAVTGNYETIYLGNNATDGTGIRMDTRPIIQGTAERKKIHGNFDLSGIELGDFRDICQREYSISIPFCGTYMLDPRAVGSRKYISWEFGMDIISGAVAATIFASDGPYDGSAPPPSAVILERVGGICGQDVPMSQTQMNRGAAVSGIMGVASLAVGAYTGSTALMAGAAGSIAGIAGAGSLSQTITNGGISGGNASNMTLNNKVQLIIRRKLTTMEPEDIASTLGRPCMKSLKLSGLSGYVQTTGASVSAVAPDDIINSINSALDAGIFLE